MGVLLEARLEWLGIDPFVAALTELESLLFLFSISPSPLVYYYEF
jgi:hypothetical protein